MSREYWVRTEFDGRRISLNVHQSASDKLAVDLLVFLFRDWVLFLEERKSVWEIVSNQSKGAGGRGEICELVSRKLFKCSYKHWAVRTL